MKIHFWGATDEVTGSMTFLVQEERIVMIDCGLCQGGKDAEEKNLIELPFSPKLISDVYLTHAHLDHCGYLPRLVKKGFKGHIHCTEATAPLVKIILEDSASLNEDHTLPLYESDDVTKTLKLIKTHPWHQKFPLLSYQAYFIPAGHILGASSLVVEADNTIIFSGDLGRSDDLLLPSPEKCPLADIVIMESTYGAKNRSGNPKDELKSFLEKVSKQNKVGIIASFALARGQMLLTLLEEIFEENSQLRIPVYFDSPMMKEINKVYKKFSSLTQIPEKLIHTLEDAESIDYERQWNWLKKKSGPIIIISSSGMVSGGRIFRHLENWQTDANSILFLPGYQAQGTIGRSLLEGQRSFTAPEGMTVTWCGEILGSDAFSSHAEQNELIDWLKDISPRQVFLLHGEKEAKESLKKTLNQYDVTIPQRGDVIDH